MESIRSRNEKKQRMMMMKREYESDSESGLVKFFNSEIH
jgi:hypothetical protein